jgi:hypothetical protein
MRHHDGGSQNCRHCCESDALSNLSHVLPPLLQLGKKYVEIISRRMRVRVNEFIENGQQNQGDVTFLPRLMPALRCIAANSAGRPIG